MIPSYLFSDYNIYTNEMTYNVPRDGASVIYGLQERLCFS